MREGRGLRSILQDYMYNCLHGLQNTFSIKSVCQKSVHSSVFPKLKSCCRTYWKKYFLSFTMKYTEIRVNAIYLQEGSYSFKCI